MLKRKIEKDINAHLTNSVDKILLIDGARQVGKTYIIRYTGKKLYKNFIEVNFIEDFNGNRIFENISNVDDFYIQLSALEGDKMGDYNDTLIFIDEIQQYPQYLTLLKFFRDDGRYRIIASGSLLGVTLRGTASIPMGSIEVKRMYPLDFEEFLIALGTGSDVIEHMKECFLSETSLIESLHFTIMDNFRKYLLVGGLPEAVNTFIQTRNITKVRKIQNEIYAYYQQDSSKYETENGKKLVIRRIYDMIPSNLKNKKKRVIIKDIEGKKGKTYMNYLNEFEYLISSGIALEVKAVSSPSFPLLESSSKNLLKLYLNDVGILTSILYQSNVAAILSDSKSISLGTVYESAAAQELKAHGFNLFYYDNRNKGEVDYLINSYEDLCITPIEIKSGKDYTVHSALNNFMKNDSYQVKKAYVFSNSKDVKRKGNIVYMPVYNIMFLKHYPEEDIYI